MSKPSWDCTVYRFVDRQAQRRQAERTFCEACQSLVYTWAQPWVLHREVCPARSRRRSVQVVTAA
jgi:hypothetical protein